MIIADSYLEQLPLTCLNLVNKNLSNKAEKVIKELLALIPLDSTKIISHYGTIFLPSTEYIFKGISCLESQIHFMQNETDQIDRNDFSEHKNNEFERISHSLTVEVGKEAKQENYYISSEFQKIGKDSEENSYSIMKNDEVYIGKDLMKNMLPKNMGEQTGLK